jgi:hypothetical protein
MYILQSITRSRDGDMTICKMRSKARIYGVHPTLDRQIVVRRANVNRVNAMPKIVGTRAGTLTKLELIFRGNHLVVFIINFGLLVTVGA